jgi:FemAB-related protein (PEP-CTERM system-associated)
MNAHASLALVRLATAADRAAILAFVERESEASLFHLPQWGEAVTRACGHRDRTLIACDGSGAVTGLLPLSEVRSPLFGSALVSAGFAIGGGVAGGPVRPLADAAWELAQTLGTEGVELRGGPIPAGWEERSGVYANFSAALGEDDEAILKAIPKRQRAEVRRAQTFGLELRTGTGPADLDAHYRTYAESVRNLGTPVFPRALFEEMIAAFGDKADILTVWKDGKPLSGVLTFYFKGCAYPYWGGGTAEARRWRANDALYYALMCHARRRGCTRFDFGRSKLGTGAFSFKKNWGFEPEPLTYAVKGKGRDTNPLDPRYRFKVEAWKRLPLWLANRLGPHIAKGLG